MYGKTVFDINLNVGYYRRVSTDKDDQLNSLENQSNYFREMIGENKKWTLVGEYVDEAKEIALGKYCKEVINLYKNIKND